MRPVTTSVWNRIALISTVNLLVALGSSCFFSFETINFDDDKQMAETLVTRFHKLFNEKKYDEMYDLFTEKGRDYLQREQFIGRLKALREASGRTKNSAVIRSEVRIIGGSRLVHLFYRTDFEESSQIEEFDCLVSGHEVLFDFYGLPNSPPDLPDGVSGMSLVTNSSFNFSKNASKSNGAPGGAFSNHRP